tara:strand:- start:2104 stop:2511 length:408 start_codon:yes stop_codon:yes gene_type:complete
MKNKSKMFRDVSKLRQKDISKNYLKNLRSTLLDFQSKYDIFQKEMYFMLWAYDLEFFTLDYGAKEYGMTKQHLGDRIVYPLMKEGYIHKYFDKLTPSQNLEDHLFREETKFNYRVRYALTQKARLMIQRFYRALN